MGSSSFVDNNIEYKIYIDESKLDILIDNILSICAKYSNQTILLKPQSVKIAIILISLTINKREKGRGNG